MALVVADRVRVQSTSSGTGSFSLGAAFTGYTTFSATVADGDTVYYCIHNLDNGVDNEWEVGLGTYTLSTDTLVRTTVLSNYLGTTATVNFSAGTKEVFITQPAEKAVFEDASGNVSGYPIVGGSINNTPIGASTPNTGAFTTLTATGQTSLGGAAGSEGLRVVTQASADIFWQIKGGSSSLAQRATFGTNSGAPNIYSTGNPIIFSTNGANSAEQLRVSHTASAVNYVQVTGAATGNSVRLTSAGSDATVGMILSSKALGNISFWSGDVSARQFQITPVASSVNYLQASGAATNTEPVLSAQGSDTDISMALQSKGTGGVNLATGSTGVNISNGTTVTAITRTNAGSGYTSFPSVAIGAPQLPSGVQATASITAMLANNPTTVQAGGTGYTVNDILTVVGGTPTGAAATYTVTAVSGGVVTAVTALNFASYSVLPTNPVTTTGGTGSGCTLNLTYGVAFGQPTITNAGSGYVEQPTVTFSGGGGSGAAAYARIGSDTTIRGLGTNILFNMPGGTGFGITDVANSVNYIRNQGASTGLQPFTTVQGSDTNISYAFTSKGTGGLNFYTNLGNQLQFAITHATSAVNWVQVTGSATGNNTVISTQGSDASVGLNLAVKGTASTFTFLGNGGAYAIHEMHQQASSVNRFRTTAVATGVSPLFSAVGSDTNIAVRLRTQGNGAFQFETGSSGNEQFRIINTTSAVNFVQVTGAATGGQPSITAQGSDTDINMFFASKNAGALIFNTNGCENFRVANGGTSVVNNIQAVGAGTTNAPSFQARGTDTNIGMNLTTKGTGSLSVNTGNGEQVRVIDSGIATTAYLQLRGGAGGCAVFPGGASSEMTLGSSGGFNLRFMTQGISNEQLRVVNTASAVNYVQVTGAATGGRPTISAQGSDTNVGLTFIGKGNARAAAFFNNSASTSWQLSVGVAGATNAVNFLDISGAAAGSAPVLSAQGTDSNVNLGLTPKAAGNVVINQGASGAQGLVLAQDIGVSANSARILFDSSGGVTSIFNVGNATTFRTGATIASSSGFEQFRVAHTASAVNFVQVTGGATGVTPNFLTAGSDTNIGMVHATKGTGSFGFWTAGGASQQFSITHTASAVNFVQVTGGTTGNQPVISAQGSDANINITINSKGNGSAVLQANGTGASALFTDGGFTGLRAIPRATSGDTWLDVQRNVGFVNLIASSAVTNGDIRLTPKGSGDVVATTGQIYQNNLSMLGMSLIMA